MDTHIDLKRPEICWEKMDNFLSKSGSLFNYNMVQFSVDKYIQEKDAKELQEVEKAIEEGIREKYNPDDLFKKRNPNNTEESNDKDENTSMIVIKEEKWYQKIFNIIKGIFKRR